MARQFNSFYCTEDKEEILIYIKYNSKRLLQIFEKDFQHDFILFRKYLSHSDLVTRGKLGSGQKVGQSKRERMKCYMLYYQSVDELLQIWKNKNPPVAGQSNIRVSDAFYFGLDIKSYEKNNRKQADIVSDYKIPTFIPYDTCADFNLEDLNKICQHNQKNQYKGKEEADIKEFNLEHHKDSSNPDLFKVASLHIAAHGLGTDDDELFSYLRSFVFKGDVLNALFDKDERILYLFFERNEKYYSLLSKCDKETVPPIWREYSKEDKEEIVKTLCVAEILSKDSDKRDVSTQASLKKDELQELLDKYRTEYSKSVKDIINSGETPKYRWYQKKWKEVLIKADELQFNQHGLAVCAISRITGDYTQLGRFFIASHIKSYADCMSDGTYEDAFDPDNGLILCANIDALFDRHLIAIDDSGKIHTKKVVKAIKDHGKYLQFKKPDKYYLNPNRKKYLAIHKEIYDRIPDE